ncbi:hypothetical protein LVD15_03420 [Fulvivirga maritima]|uniref:hypothetical protein n=1 Tax=Fulvivirga maritima TaxID=2904247 RepID=UPI001F46F5CB|nr:hypothetical protein [Fulvivirga maritima]UII27495.1 hypothetical protein LVD15_03420 [Fulvivirga maritima]
MNKFQLLIIAAFLWLSGHRSLAQENELSAPDSVKLNQEVTKDKPKEGGDRNVMLNASSNTGPRDVNIGLPPSVGGITILENDLPSVYYFWPELPNRSWRPSVSLEKTGLLKMDELATSMGDLGFAVNSYTQTGTKDFHFKGKFSGSHYGWIQGDVNVSGPLTKNGWTYSAGAFLNYDPDTYDLKSVRNADETKIFRAGITKYFKDDKGKITAAYKYANSYSVTNYALFRYQEGGEAQELDGFTFGKGSFIVNDGTYRFKELISGEYYSADIDGNQATTESHTIDVFGNYQLNNGWNFKYSTRYHSAKTSLLYQIPLSITENVDASAGYTYANTGDVYTGNVATQLAMNSPNIPTKTLMGRFSLNKTIKNHTLQLGVLEQYYHIDDYHSNRSFFYQTVEDQPSKLISPNTDEYGFYGYNAGGEFYKGTENKLSFFGTDKWEVNDKLSLNYGVHIRYHNIKGDFLASATNSTTVMNGEQTASFNEGWLQLGGKINANYNLTKNFGLIGNFLYTEENGRLNDFSTSFVPNLKTRKTPLGALGVFWNTPWLSLVSQATYLYKNNYLQRYNFVNPANSSESQNGSVNYDIQTIGWTTDLVLTPFKGFRLHYLITLQDPVYKKFTFGAFGNDYDYSDNNVLEISKTLMEIDPSYTIGDWRIWASFRYFSRQYSSLTNVLYFKARWENFGGIDYKVNDHIDVGATVVNFLNQRGAKGTINGSELITDPSQYYGQLLTSSYIRPFTVQASVNIHF